MNRRLCRGKRLDNGEWIQGYYGAGAFLTDGGSEIHHHFITVWTIHSCSPHGYFTDYEVDPATVEPVKVKPKDKDWGQHGDRDCPCCGHVFWVQTLESKKPNYCEDCGQALDWAKGSAE